jgi:hypothetical protein
MPPAARSTFKTLTEKETGASHIVAYRNRCRVARITINESDAQVDPRRVELPERCALTQSILGYLCLLAIRAWVAGAKDPPS